MTGESALHDGLVRLWEEKLAEATDPEEKALYSALRDAAILGDEGRASRRFADRLHRMRLWRNRLAGASTPEDAKYCKAEFDAARIGDEASKARVRQLVEQRF